MPTGLHPGRFSAEATAAAPAPSNEGPLPQVAATPTVVMALPEPRVPTPERFSGDLKKFRAFKNACTLYFALQPRTFASEVVKVGFAISLLSEEPQAWAHGLMESGSQVLNTIDTFFESMSQLYDDPQRMATAEAILHHLVQGRRPIEDYTVEFRKWAADTNWNEPALRYQYRQGLSKLLKDELARMETPASLEELIQAATKLDRRLRERRSERFQNPRPAWTASRLQPIPISSPITAGPTTLPDSEPMQFGLIQPPLTSEERQRRRQSNLCLYCGGAGHFLRNCPIRPSKFFQPKTMTYQDNNTSKSYVMLFISLQLPEGHHLPAIIDSGACSCFMDAALAREPACALTNQNSTPTGSLG